jgi:hypothetical protein
MAHIAVLQGNYDHASAWFEKSRAVTEEAGLRPVRAIVDHEEATTLMNLGREDEALALPKAGQEQFINLGMIGWIDRAKRLIDTGSEWVHGPAGPP